MPDAGRGLDVRESPIVRNTIDEPIEKAVDLRIQEQLVRHAPRVAWQFWIQPRVIYGFRGSLDVSFEFEFEVFGCGFHSFIF